MMKFWPIKCLLCIVLIGLSCKERYNPDIPSYQSNYLVVEGFINVNGSTTITLSRTTPLKDSSERKSEVNAQVKIEGEDNSTYTVGEVGNGTYKSNALTLNTNQKYRLHIKTVTGGEYLSDYADVKPTPPIDSVSWKMENDGVRIFVNTHDPRDNTRYYKWDYEETWEIHSHYGNYVKYVNGFIINRPLSEVDKLFYCWITQNSSSILLGSTVQLQNDVISEAPVMFIPYESEKTSVRYSILVKQYSLDKKAYDFYKMLKSNTESLGSVFDPLPSEITGNITCVSDSREKALGYITAATVDEKRIFITGNEVHTKYNMGCPNVFVDNKPDSLKKYFSGGDLLPYQADNPMAPTGYYGSYPLCIDCTLRGSSVKPAFW